MANGYATVIWINLNTVMQKETNKKTMLDESDHVKTSDDTKNAMTTMRNVR